MAIADNFDTLAGAFEKAANESTIAYQSPNFLVSRYKILMRHNARTPQQRKDLTDRLVTAVLKHVVKSATANYGIYYGNEGKQAEVGRCLTACSFKTLTSDDYAQYLPTDTAERIMESLVKLQDGHDAIIVLKSGSGVNHQEIQKDRELYATACTGISDTLLDVLDHLNPNPLGIDKPVVVSTTQDTTAAPALKFKPSTGKHTP